MNIGIDAHMLGHHETGNETYILELVRALAQRETGDLFFVYVEARDVLPLEVREARHVHIIEYSTRSSVRRLLYELPQRAARDRLDVLHVSYNAPPYLPASCALVVTIHDISFELHPEWFPRTLRAFLRISVPRSARAAARILTDTESAKHDLVEMYRLPADKIHVTPYAAQERFAPIHNADALSAIRAKYNTSAHFILAVGNMQPRKNWIRLMQAFARAKLEYNLPHKLVMVGQRLWLAEAVFEQARALGDDIVFTGYVPAADLPLLYNAADIFCYPSLYEGFGLPVLEAMACGVPVITSNVSALPEVVADAARMVNPYDVGELAGALHEMLTDARYREQFAQKGLARARSFSWERTAQVTLDGYRLALRPAYTHVEISTLET